MVLHFYIHQIHLSVRLPKRFDSAASWLERDYHHFITPSPCQARIRVFACTRHTLHARKLGFLIKTRYSRSRGWKTKTIEVDRSHRIFLRGRNPYFALMIGNDEVAIYEMLDRLILSSVGELLDQQGLHRLHAFSFCDESGNAVIVTGRPGVGKSYLATLANDANQHRIFSDEVSLIRNSQLLPFPISLSVEERFKNQATDHPIQRKGGHTKWRRALSRPALLPSKKIRGLVLAKRSHSNQWKVKPATIWQKLWFVLGVGLGLGQMQMLEFTLRSALLWELPRVFISRLRSATGLILTTPTVTVCIPNDATWEQFVNHLNFQKKLADVSIG